MRILFMIMAMFSVSLVFYGAVLTVHAQSDFQTTKHRNIVIDLGNGLKTNARLNLPASGDGPFPGGRYGLSGVRDNNNKVRYRYSLC
jgi:hypothetical protein